MSYTNRPRIDKATTVETTELAELPPGLHALHMSTTGNPTSGTVTLEGLIYPNTWTDLVAVDVAVHGPGPTIRWAVDTPPCRGRLRTTPPLGGTSPTISGALVSGLTMDEAGREAYVRQFVGGPVKIDEDLQRYKHVINLCRPEVIVEAGSWRGESARFFSRFAPVISVDIDHSNLADGSRDNPGITWIEGNSVDPKVVAQVRELVGDRRALVSLDSDHGYDHALAEIRAYSTLVPAGGYMVVEDGVVNEKADAIRDWITDNPGWVAEYAIDEDFGVTLSPFGWLRNTGRDH